MKEPDPVQAQVDDTLALVTGEMGTETYKRRKSNRGSWLRRRVRQISPYQLLFRKYKLTKKQRAVMFAWGFVLAYIATPVGNAIYYLATQVRYGTQNAGAPWFILFYLKDTWDRLPVHVQNLLGAHWFTGQGAPPWWVTARHDARHVLIGILILLLVGSVTIGLSGKPRKRVRPAWIALSPVTTLIAAIPGAAVGIVIFVKTPVGSWVMRWGARTGFPPVDVWVAKGTWQLTLIGLLAGYFFARRVFNPVADTIQLTSIEKHITERETPKWWWKLVYPPNYRNRYALIVAEGRPCQPHGKTMGVIMFLAAPVFLSLLAYGIWLTYFSGILPH